MPWNEGKRTYLARTGVPERPGHGHILNSQLKESRTLKRHFPLSEVMKKNNNEEKGTVKIPLNQYANCFSASTRFFLLLNCARNEIAISTVVTRTSHKLLSYVGFSLSRILFFRSPTTLCLLEIYYARQRKG